MWQFADMLAYVNLSNAGTGRRMLASFGRG